MRRSVPAMVVALAFWLTAGCAARKPHPPPPPFEARTATLDITNGIKVLAMTAMPPGFPPDPARPPVWLRDGSEIAVAGESNGKAVILGLSGEALADRRVIATDFGPGAPHGRIVDFAASPNGRRLAIAIFEPSQSRIQLALRDIMSNKAGHSIASFSGEFNFVQLAWIDRKTIVIALQPPASPQIDSQPGDSPPAGGLYVVDLGAVPKIDHLDGIKCGLSRLSWSPNGRFAVGQGSASALPVIIDRKSGVCAPFPVHEPIRVLGWSPRSGRFLYATTADRGRSVGVFRYDLVSGRSALIAVSSQAAAWASNGSIIAVGNSKLSWRRVAQEPNAMAKVEVAVFDPVAPEVQINSLGFETLPAMIAHSTITFSPASDDAIIDTYVPAIGATMRKLIEYSSGVRSAFLIATGPALGPVAMSWSPNGRVLALLDGNAQHSVLTLLVPPR